MNFELQSFLHGHNFTHNFYGQRPPTVGEEDEITSVDGRMSSHSSVSGKSEVSTATPRRTDIDLGFEPEGSASPLPSYERWKLSLLNMLEDSEGIRLFKLFLADTKQLDLLDCWLACKGFRNSAMRSNHSNNSSAASSTTGPLSSQRSLPDSAILLTRGKLAKKIFNTYFKKDKCAVSRMIKDATRQYICKQIKHALQAQKDPISALNGGELDADLFDQAQNEIELNVEENSYQAFLSSDIFRQYAAQCESKHLKQSSQSTSTTQSTDPKNHNQNSSASTQQVVPVAAPIPGRYGPLDTLAEDRVWHPPHQRSKSGTTSGDKQISINSTMSSGMSQSSLARTAMERSMAVSNESFSYPSDIGDQNRPANPYYIASSVSYYVPPASANVSDQASSDATSESLSVTDSSVDGVPPYSSKKHQKRMIRQQRKMMNAAVNFAGENHFIPLTRSARCNYKQEMANLATEHPDKFFAQLKVKLEKVAEERRRAAALEVAAMDDVNDILDSHIERVMKTPIGVDSPRNNRSPPPLQPPVVPALASQSRHRHSPTRGVMHSTLADVQNDARHYHHHQKVNHAAYQNKGPLADQNTLTRKTDSLRRRKEAQYAMAPNEVPEVDTPIQPVDRNYMTYEWIKQTTNNTNSVKTDSLQRKRTNSTKVSQPQRHPYVNRGTGFPIQAVVTSKANQFQSQPLQPISQDPAMPPLDQPDTSTTIEEVKRRLIEETERKDVNPMQQYASNPLAQSYPGLADAAKGSMMAGHSFPHASEVTALSSGSESTLLSEHNNRDFDRSDSGYKVDSVKTTCVYYLPKEEMAYKIQVPYRPVTLGMFKTFLSRKGNYRYYFKQFSREIAGPVLFEITKDSEELPLWENTIVAKLGEV